MNIKGFTHVLKTCKIQMFSKCFDFHGIKYIKVKQTLEGDKKF